MGDMLVARRWTRAAHGAHDHHTGACGNVPGSVSTLRWCSKGMLGLLAASSVMRLLCIIMTWLHFTLLKFVLDVNTSK